MRVIVSPLIDKYSLFSKMNSGVWMAIDTRPLRCCDLFVITAPIPKVQLDRRGFNISKDLLQ